MNEFFLLTLAAAVSMLVIPVAWRFAPHLGMIDMPDARKVHVAPIPRIGGWGITLGSLAPLVLLFPFDPLLQSFVFGSLVLFCFGLWDDARQIDHWRKFTGQIIAVAIVVYHGDLYVTRLPFLDGYALDPLIGRPFTMFAMIGVINAINHSDGLDGLAGGESMLSLIAFAYLGYIVDNSLVVGMALAAIGGTFGFLRHNTHPAKVFMGDAGSQFLGFALGFLAVYLTQVAYPVVSAALPLLLLGLPLADIVAVLFQRIRARMSWFKATRNHVHHRLLDRGFTHFETVVIIYSIQASLVVSAALLRYESDVVVIVAYLGVVGCLFAGLTLAEHNGWTARPTEGPQRSVVPAALRKLVANRWLRALPFAFIFTAVPAFMLLCSVWVESVPRDFGMVAAMLAVVLAVQIGRNRAAGSLIVRAAIYVAAIFSVYLFTLYPGAEVSPVTRIANIGMICLALAIGVFVRFLAERRFQTTPTDYLILFGVLALVAFDSIDIRDGATAQFITYAILLFYGCELIVSRIAVSRHVFHFATLAVLVILSVRPLLG